MRAYLLPNLIDGRKYMEDKKWIYLLKYLMRTMKELTPHMVKFLCHKKGVQTGIVI